MTRFIEFLISLLIVAVLFVLIGAFLPAKRSFSFSIETNRPMATVNDLFNGFSRFKDWNPLLRYDPRMPTELSGPAMGQGAKFSYRSRDKVIGSGSWEIVESVPGEMVRYKLVNEARGDEKTMTVKLERTGQRNQNIKITQTYRVDYGWDLLGRYAGLYVNRNVGDDIKRGLEKFSNLLATIPKFDYTQHAGEFTFAEAPAQDVLLVTTAAKRSNEEIALAMTNQLSWIKKVMEANGLESAGPLRIVTNEFTGDTYGFDVMMPVRKKASLAAASIAASVPADASASTVAGVTLDVKLEGPVTYEQLPARRVAMTTYTGPAPGLPRVRDLLRAWAMTRGADTLDRPYEEYLSGIESMINEDAQFKVYWPVKNP
jgi:effector-binding domain-containing protein